MFGFKNFERKFISKTYQTIAGLDEAGRGPWAGPLVAAAVILPPGLRIQNLKDSKQLTENQRNCIFKYLLSKVDFGLGIISNSDIDERGLKSAIQQAFTMAISNLKKRPDYLLIDGKDNLKFEMPHTTFIRGDTFVRSIACASIIAKVTRDKIMRQYSKLFPVYQFDKHKGYGTEKHNFEIIQNGICKIHRKSYKPISALLNK